MKKFVLGFILLSCCISFLLADNVQLGKGMEILEPSSKPVLISTLNGDPLNPFGRQIDTLYYDDGTGAWGYQGNSNALFWAVRFTPTQNSEVLAGIFQVWIISGSAPVCTCFVWDDAAGTPGAIVDGPVVQTAAPYPSWTRADFSGGYQDADDFWVGYWLPWWSPGDSSRALTDASSEYGSRQAIGVRSGGGFNWNVNPGLNGDLMIRAIVQHVTGVSEEQPSGKFKHAVYAFPNPMKTTSTISYSVPIRTNVEINIYDISGRLVRQVEYGTVEQGQHAAKWDRKDSYGLDVPQGLYLYEFITPSYKATGKIIVIH